MMNHLRCTDTKMKKITIGIKINDKVAYLQTLNVDWTFKLERLVAVLTVFFKKWARFN